MISIAHHEAFVIAATVASGDFSFVTTHTKKGTNVRWTWSEAYQDYVSPEHHPDFWRMAA
jgi:hypothetical protein